ncbi:MAG: hypothetical protein LQ338_002716 [Usnochroma carphineum]|nr:MAG: hypothetical protein LQ338_002716 [Usnochroma carphineum]
MSGLQLIFALIVISAASTFLRFLYVLPAFNPTRPRRRIKGQSTRLLVVLGSGGHTAEMLSLLHDLDPALYTHRSYVLSSGDDFSALKAVEFESTIEAKNENVKQDFTTASSTYDISVIPRARRIHQSLFTAPVSSLRCLFACFAILRAPGTQKLSHSDTDQQHISQRSYPDLIVANGPATAVLVIIASLILRFFNIRGTEGKMRTIYIESWARVSTLSLSGKILMAGGMVNRMLVQWENLAQRGQGEFRGALVR